MDHGAEIKIPTSLLLEFRDNDRLQGALPRAFTAQRGNERPSHLPRLRCSRLCFMGPRKQLQLEDECPIGQRLEEFAEDFESSVQVDAADTGFATIPWRHAVTANNGCKPNLTVSVPGISKYIEQKGPIATVPFSVNSCLLTICDTYSGLIHEPSSGGTSLPFESPISKRIGFGS